MVHQPLSFTSLLSSLAMIHGATASVISLVPRTCFPTENGNQLCYRAPDNDPQGVDVKDVQFIASYLRAYGAGTRAGRLFSMAAKDTPDCADVLFADIATTIDGGPNATPEQQAAALIGCASDGGSLGVAVNASNPTYKGSTYPKGYVTKGILVKIVATN
ncbi:hypothetical protein NLG97_g5560 [Lecanicillium saksenae]|uniref:Uncharacterized protein n=1 Tax=Lecanicillium saksenae TaxID=468837 RepID=A0ACC1QSM9_9HYPO|nr:hypothetical protein NLG97_g5560 [Lecanicillium saksenae]